MEAQELGALMKRSDIRSADRANIRAMLARVRHGEDLSYQERQNLFAYLNRYGIPAIREVR